MNATVLQLKNVLTQLVMYKGYRARQNSVFLVTSNPETVDDTDFKFSDPDINLKYYSELSKDPRRVELLRKDDVVLYEYPTQYALLDTASHEVLYYMQYTKRRILKTPSVTQIKVWSSPYSKYTRKPFEGSDSITSYVFFEHLFPKTELIATDGQQTMAGKRFWEKRIAEAFESGLKVYGLDQNQHAVMQFEDLKEWVAFSDYFYGEENKFQGRKILITAKHFEDKNIEAFR